NFMNNKTEYTNVDPFFKEFDDELLQINVEEVSIKMNNELAVEKFFDIRTFELNQEEKVKKNSNTYSQRHITSIDKDWSIEDIFSLS
ncbi:25081_t:CDS:1, partial [Dentiscutata erythropus]